MREKYWLDVCNVVASNSKCLSRKVGAIIVRDTFIVSTGYNGPPIGYPHCNNFDTLNSICPRRKKGYEASEGLEYCPAVHAERNAISIAAKLGHSTDRCTIYLNCGIPCFECAKSLINAGIKEVVVKDMVDYEKRGIYGRELFTSSGVKIRGYELG